MVKCNICIEDFSVLSIIDFKNMIWKQGSKFEEIKNNEFVEKTELALCRDCRKSIFDTSKVTICFSYELLEALKQKEKLEVKSKVEEKQICLQRK